MWQWAHYLCTVAESIGKEPLFINFDETSIPLVFKGSVGNVLCRLGSQKLDLPRERHGQRSHRAFFTFVAFICSNPSVQPLLPQVIIVAARDCSLDTFNTLYEELPDNVFLKRLPKGWNNKEVMLSIAEILGLVLQPLMHRFQPIVSFDTAPCHLHSEIWDVFRLHGLYWHIIPAKLTGLLQPCDTHAFLSFKRFMKQGEQDMRLVHANRAPFVGMVRLVVEGIRLVLQGTPWLRAFADDGLCGADSNISGYIRKELALPPEHVSTPLMPTVQELVSLFPAGRGIDGAAILATQPGSDGAFAATLSPSSPVLVVPSADASSDTSCASADDLGSHVSHPGDDDDMDGFFDNTSEEGSLDDAPPPPPAHPAPKARMNKKGPIV